ncbi:MAG TPA: TetR/AcrR family transcriptional regulator [Candidatus Acidoferrum sp.]|nr:TetR/AcrR family transcriptional regulator [Candidatus Acidoferrum sp.]
MFGKPGRPREDRIERRREIWAAVSPLIEKSGARSLTMRQAAAASFLSLGGLYHYFPDKRSLVLYGLDQDAHERVCVEFKQQYGHLKDVDPQAAADAFIRFFGARVSFIRPAIRAALELGAEDFMSRLETNINMGLEGFIEVLRLALPESDERDMRAVARSARRVVLAGLMDRSVTQSEIEEELRAVVAGVPVGRRVAPLLASAG